MFSKCMLVHDFVPMVPLYLKTNLTMLYHMTQVLVGIPYDSTEKLTYVNRTFQFFHNLLSLKTNYVRSFHLLLSKCLEHMINYMFEGNKYKIPYQIAYWTKSNYKFNF